MKKLPSGILRHSVDRVTGVGTTSVKLVPKNVATRADPCAPIGQTADHQLVYSLKCDHLPAPPAPPPQAEAAPPSPPEPGVQVQHSGIFGMSSSVAGSSSNSDTIRGALTIVAGAATFGAGQLVVHMRQTSTCSEIKKVLWQ